MYGQGMAGVFPSIKRARIAKTLRYLADPNAFALALGRDVERLVREAKARGMKPAVRINGTSDLPKLAKVVAHRYPEVQFYDYTKIPKPWLRVTDNYHLTFSFSGTNERDCIAALEHGVNVAVVFHGALPDTWQGYKVVDGDKNDLRFLDPKGVVVGLKAKGAARKAEVGGFIQIGAPKPKYQSTAVATRKEVEAILAMGRTDVAV